MQILNKINGRIWADLSLSIFALAGATWAKLGQVSGVGVVYHSREWEVRRGWFNCVQWSEFA